MITFWNLSVHGVQVSEVKNSKILAVTTLCLHDVRESGTGSCVRGQGRRIGRNRAMGGTRVRVRVRGRASARAKPDPE